MSAETLRRAASEMRRQHGPEHVRHEMWAAMADWVDEAADHLAVGEDDTLDDPCPTAIEGTECSVLGQALVVARAYLGETP